MTYSDILATDNTDEHIEKLYLEFCNNFISVEKFAEYYSLSVIDANRIIQRGRIRSHEK